MTLRLHNTLSGSKEPFAPLAGDEVRMYTCGPTVYDFAHLGNFRAFLTADLLKRHLELLGYRVRHVMNITDIDDRIIARAASAGVSAAEYSRRFEAAFFEDLAQVRAEAASVYPRASEHIGPMVELIERLIAGGHAYAHQGDVYFRVDSFPAYGQLSHLDRAGLKPGARVAQDEYDKESAVDFALWKHAEPVDEEVGAAWEAPFGRGRPGWHIECSAMSMEYLGPSFDIHGGGVDLEFPHHENEIAQSESVTGQRLAHFWVHNEHLILAGGAKMAKRLGNFSTLRDLLAQGHDPLALRYFLLAGAHYRQKLTLDDQSLHAAAEQVRRLQEFAARLAQHAPAGESNGLAETARQGLAGYRAALDDDLNLTQGVGHVFEVVREANAAMDRRQLGESAKASLQELLAVVDRHLDILSPAVEEVDAEIEQLIREREAARARRDYARSDAIREELRRRGIVLEDSREGVRWRRQSPTTPV